MPHRFLSLWKRIGAKSNPNKELKYILDKYNDKGRHYHNMLHVFECLDELKTVELEYGELTKVETALWYHDIIYRPLKPCNEELSAIMAYDHLKDAEVSKDFRWDVKDLVVMTNHKQEPQTFEDKIIIDIDLSRLGVEEEKFHSFTQKIKNEYCGAGLDEKSFNKGRKDFLEAFLKRESIYYTEMFQEKYEKKAVNNLKSSLQNFK